MCDDEGGGAFMSFPWTDADEAYRDKQQAAEVHHLRVLLRHQRDMYALAMDGTLHNIPATHIERGESIEEFQKLVDAQIERLERDELKNARERERTRQARLAALEHEMAWKRAEIEQQATR